MGTIKQLRYWAFKILPLVYDNSLSYYEVLSKVTSKLNEVINTTNELPEAISAEIEKQLKGDGDVFQNLFSGIVNAIATDEGDATYTANDKEGGELIWLNGTLYEVVRTMAAGTNYIVGTNIVPVSIDTELQDIIKTISSHNEYWNERASEAHDTNTYLWWKGILYRADADIKVNDVLAIMTTENGETTGQLTQVNVMDEITKHYLEMHEADNNLQTQIDGNDGDIENLRNTGIDLQKQITKNNTDVNSRIDNIIAQSSTDNTEIVDARKKANSQGGSVAGSLGTAIREQIDNVNTGLNLDGFGASVPNQFGTGGTITSPQTNFFTVTDGVEGVTYIGHIVLEARQKIIIYASSTIYANLTVSVSNNPNAFGTRVETPKTEEPIVIVDLTDSKFDNLFSQTAYLVFGLTNLTGNGWFAAGKYTDAFIAASALTEQVSKTIKSFTVRNTENSGISGNLIGTKAHLAYPSTLPDGAKNEELANNYYIINCGNGNTNVWRRVDLSGRGKLEIYADTSLNFNIAINNTGDNWINGSIDNTERNIDKQFHTVIDLTDSAYDKWFVNFPFVNTYIVFGYSGTAQDNKIIIGEQNHSVSIPTILPSDLRENYSDIIRTVNADYIAWGDSLTAGAGGDGITYEKVAADILNCSVLNCGVGGETANTIACRQGGNNFIIPAGDINGQYGENDFKDIFGGTIKPLKQGSVGVNSIYVNDIPCTLTRNNDNSYTISGYTEAASNIPVLAHMSGSYYIGKVYTIWVGTNGSTVGSDTSVNARITIINSMIKHLQNNNYIILGLSNGTEETRAEDDSAMLNEYGARFFPTRKMLVDYGLTVMNITPTEQDNTDISNGTVPSSLRSDNVHLNASGYTALGKMLANKMLALGFKEAIERPVVG